MSWGERSCVNCVQCNHATFESCNVDCPHYEWDKETEPDSVKTKEEANDGDT